MKSVKAATKLRVRVPEVIRQTKRARGEGDHHAARRHRASVESFVKSGQVEGAARDAEPKTPVEEMEMFNAERIGKARSRGEDPESCS
jgi:hypothetical protein